MAAVAKAVNKRDRQESDLLLNVVFAHMTFGNTRREPDREFAHHRFIEAVRTLYQFLKADDTTQ